MVSNGFYTAKRYEHLGGYIHTKGTLDEALQPHLVKRIECEIGLYVVFRSYTDFLLLLNILADDPVFCPQVLCRLVVFILCIFHVILAFALYDSVELVALQLVQLCSRQRTLIDKDAHQLLVV